jgi:Glycosyltransferases involved in cell wall biogenesis
MNNPKVSVLVPIYGVEKYIERCARSLFEQTFEDIEYIFVNDCTPDQSVEILKNTLEEYKTVKSKVRIIQHDKNRGIAAVRNTCIENANGIYTLFVDSDDKVEKNMVELLFNKAIKENAEIVSCQYYFSYIDHEELKEEFFPKDLHQRMFNIISLNNSAFMWRLLIKKELYTNNKLRFIDGINVAEDYIMVSKLLYYARRISYVDEPLYHYTKYNPQNYSQLSIRNIEDRINAAKELDLFFRASAIYDHIKEALDGRKFIIKTVFILNNDYEDFDRWKRTFPESDYAWRLFYFRFDYKIIYWLAEKHMFKCIRLIKIAKSTLSKINHLLKK